MKKPRLYSIDIINTFRKPTEEEHYKILQWFKAHIKTGVTGEKVFNGIILLMGSLILISAIFRIIDEALNFSFDWGSVLVLISGAVFTFVGIFYGRYLSRHKEVLISVEEKDYWISEVIISDLQGPSNNGTLLCKVKTVEGKEYDEWLRIVEDEIEIGSIIYLVYCPLARKYDISDFIERPLSDFMLSKKGLKRPFIVISHTPTVDL